MEKEKDKENDTYMTHDQHKNKVNKHKSISYVYTENWKYIFNIKQKYIDV